MPDDAIPTTKPIALAADPGVRFLGALDDCPRTEFQQIPSHHEQRQPELHAARLIRAGMLAHALDTHRNGAAAISTTVGAGGPSWKPAGRVLHCRSIATPTRSPTPKRRVCSPIDHAAAASSRARSTLALAFPTPLI